MFPEIITAFTRRKRRVAAQSFCSELRVCLSLSQMKEWVRQQDGRKKTPAISEPVRLCDNFFTPTHSLLLVHLISRSCFLLQFWSAVGLFITVVSGRGHLNLSPSTINLKFQVQWIYSPLGKYQIHEPDIIQHEGKPLFMSNGRAVRATQ